MPEIVASAVVRGIPPEVFIAEDQETLNWVLALRLIARTPGHVLDEGLRDELRLALREERWADAVEMWMDVEEEVDIYSSFDLYTARDVELAAHELEFTPLFRN